MNIKIYSVKTIDEITTVSLLANEIWRKHFTPVIGSEQVIYMLENFQNVPAILSQIESGWLYYLAQLNEQFIGYIALVPDADNKRLMISKLYVKQVVRGQGVGRYILEFVEGQFQNKGIETLWLTVNRHNLGPVEFYKKYGFIIVDEVVKDIGGGFVMDDFIMEKPLGKACVLVWN